MDIHAMTAAVLLKKVLGPSEEQSQDALVSADGTLRRADVSQRPHHTWHGAFNFSSFSERGKTPSKVSSIEHDPDYLHILFGLGKAVTMI